MNYAGQLYFDPALPENRKYICKIVLDIPLDDSKELKGLTLETLSNDVVIVIMVITLQ